jgi:hypothetical protein
MLPKDSAGNIEISSLEHENSTSDLENGKEEVPVHAISTRKMAISSAQSEYEPPLHAAITPCKDESIH